MATVEPSFSDLEEIRLAAATTADGTRRLRLAVPGMNCGGCIANLERAVNAVPGITEARANLTRKSITVSWKDATFDPARISEAIRGAGFDAFPIDAEDVESADVAETRDLLTRMAVAGFAAMNVMLLSVSVWAGASDATRDLMHWISAAIALPTVIYAGRPFFVSALRGLRAGHLNMDAPISLAVILAAIVSLSEVFQGGEDAYFDAAVMLLFLLLIGRWLDRTMRAKARSAAYALGRLSPRGAWVLDEDGKRQYRPTTALKPGDDIAVDAGDRLPVDGTVISGSGSLDAALVTGESHPVSVTVGDRVEAGVLSLDATLVVKATAVGEDTSLTEIARLCAAAEDRKSRLARLADKAAAIYAPLVHLIAFLTLVGWMMAGASFREALLVAVAVLIVTCPCALGLAAPMAQAVASGALFRRGIMLKDGAALERLALIDHAVFDKTGVLTMGTLAVEDDGGLQGDAAARAMGLAIHSSHPLARALVSYGTRQGWTPITPENVTEAAGSGLTAQVAGQTIKLGSATHCGLDASSEDAQRTECWIIDGDAAPMRVTFTDVLRPDAAATVEALHKAGIETTLLSGDRAGVAQQIGDTVGMDKSTGELRPADKIGFVEARMAEQHTVLMVGDGINDAPALSAASVSMAPASGSDIGRTASDLVFTGASLNAVTDAWKIARKTRRVILQNFALAAGYNTIAIPLAVMGLAGPLVAAIAMSTSSLLVTLNALRLAKGDNA